MKTQLTNSIESTYISAIKEFVDNQLLIKQIVDSGFVDDSMIIVNLDPYYSSYLVQVANHKLSYLNKNQLFEQVNLYVPSPSMSQVYNQCDEAWQLYPYYLADWVKKNILPKQKYLFLSAYISKDKEFPKVYQALKGRIEPEKYLFVSTYVDQDSPFKPMFHVEHIEKPVLFSWQNSNLK